MPPAIPPAQQHNAPPPRGPADHPSQPPTGRASRQAAAQRRDRRLGESPHQRQGDRGSEDDGDDDAGRRLPTFVRFRDIKASGIAASWTQLSRLIDDEGFPPGIMLSPNIRAWRLDDVQLWLANRPTERKGVPDRWEQRRQQAETTT